MLIGRVSPAPHPSMEPHCPTVPPRPCHAACLLPQPNPASCPSRRPTLQITQPLVLPAGPCLSHPFCLCKCCSSCRECTPQHTHTCFNSWVCPCDLFRKPSLHPLCGCVRGSLHGPLHAACASPSRVPTRQCCWGWSRPGAAVPGWALPPQGARPRASHTEGRREGLHSAEPKSWERHALLPTDRPLATRLSYFYLSPCRAEAGQAGSPTESVRPARRREDTCCGCRGRRLAGRPHGLLYLESCRPRATNPLLWESPARRSWVRGPALPRSP